MTSENKTLSISQFEQNIDLKKYNTSAAVLSTQAQKYISAFMNNKSFMRTNYIFIDKITSNNAPSLCEFCNNSICNGCSWSFKYKPVKDWEAIPSILPNHYGSFKNSFLVCTCPKFSEDTRTYYYKTDMADVCCKIYGIKSYLFMRNSHKYTEAYRMYSYYINSYRLKYGCNPDPKTDIDFKHESLYIASQFD